MIETRPGTPLSERALALVREHPNVHLGFSPRLPENAPVIRFRRFGLEAPTLEGLDPRLAGRVQAIFDVFDGAFVAALLFAQDEDGTKRRTNGTPDIIRAGSALVSTLLDRFFDTYVVVSQAA